MRLTEVSPLGQRTGQGWYTQKSQHGLKSNSSLLRFLISFCMNWDNLRCLLSKPLLCPNQETGVASLEPHCSGRQLLSLNHVEFFFQIQGLEVTSPKNFPVLEAFSVWPHSGKPLSKVLWCKDKVRAYLVDSLESFPIQIPLRCVAGSSPYYCLPKTQFWIQVLFNLSLNRIG